MMDPQQNFAPASPNWRAWMPNRGNILTIVIVVTLLVVQNSTMLTLGAPSASQLAISTFAYQGRLADTEGVPLTGTYSMIFRLYNAPTGGSPLWDEQWTGSNSVQVSDGLFNVMLGSLNPIPQSIVTGSPTLYLGLTVNTDNEMSPRVQLGSVPYAYQALTVPDGSITNAKLAPDVSVIPPDGSITAEKLHPDLHLVPSGVIVMWHGSVETIPDDWLLCDGSNNTPDLRSRFVVGAGSQYAVGATGGNAQVTLTVAQMPPHSHTGTTNVAGGHSHEMPARQQAAEGNDIRVITGRDPSSTISTQSAGSHSHTLNINNTGGGQPFDNRPPYYALAFICKQ